MFVCVVCDTIYFEGVFVMGRNIGFCSSDWVVDIAKNDYVYPLIPNGCTWYRMYLPSKELFKYGWSSRLGITGWNDNIGFVAGDGVGDWSHLNDVSDVIVFKLIMYRPFLDRIYRAKALGQKIVVDVDDWFKDIPKSNMAYERTDPLVFPTNNRDIYEQIILAADAVVCSTQFLYDYYSSVRDNVFLVNNGVDLKRFAVYKHSDSWHPTIGWVGMTPWRAGDLEECSWMNDFLVKNDLRFHHSGAQLEHKRTIEEVMGLDAGLVSKSPTVPTQLVGQLYDNMDIGIVPLSDHVFNHSKSFLKGLEYAASGIPFVASWSPEYQFLADAGVGRVARSQEEWEYHLSELLDPDLRAAEAALNLKIVKDKFSMHIRGKEWNKVFQKIISL
jgi:hypothetical protein